MHRTMAIFSSLAVVVSALGVMGCSSKSPSPSPSGCDMTTPVSFSNDVIPIFKTTCALTSVCHGQMNNVGEESLYLGENSMSMATTDPSALHSMLVGVPSKEDPSMNLVTAGDTATSYLWHKIDGDQNTATIASGCAMATCSNCMASMPCGLPMPDTAAALGDPVLGEPVSFCKISSWISQGALNN
jgi:hypothetical protein